MDLAAALAADLADLSRALDRHEIDLETLLRTLIDDLGRALPSYLGLRMTMIIEGSPLSFSTYQHRDASSKIASSLTVPLSAVSGAAGGSSLVLYAAVPGAFVDLAADLSYALQLELTDLVIAEVGPAGPVGVDGIAGLSARRDFDRAVGVLVGRGHSIGSADAELRRRAILDGGSLDEAAAAILASTAKPDIDPIGPRT